jgi:transcriptional accessory protein Tex/SPT6
MRKRTDANPNAQIDPHALYRVGQTCAVRVKSVDIARQRIAVELP